MSTPAAYAQPIDQPPPLAAAAPYGGFWIRFAAYLVDGFIIGALTIVVALVWALAAGGSESNLLSLILLALGQCYHAYFVSSEKMATPGKRMCGLYVTDLEGRRIGFGRALWRNLAAFFSYLTLYIGFFMAGFTARKQALHDKMAGTLVHRQPGSGAGAVVIVIVVVFFLVFVVGILAAIAIPAYQDYTVRAKVSGVLGEVGGAKTQVMEYAAKNQAWPTNWDQVGGNPADRLNPQTREIVSDMQLGEGGAIVVGLDIHGKQGQLVLTPSPEGAWSCANVGEIRKYVPAACRE